MSTPRLEKFVSAKLGSGRYNPASEVVREALRLLDQHDSARAAQLAEFNGELGRRLASLDRGEAPGEWPTRCPDGQRLAADPATIVKRQALVMRREASIWGAQGRPWPPTP